MKLGVDISSQIEPKWEILPKRWIVERYLTWINNSRSLFKDYEISVPSALSVLLIAFSYLAEKIFAYWYSRLGRIRSTD